MKNLISLKSAVLLASIVFMAMVNSCTKEGSGQDPDIEYSTDNEHIKSVSANGAIVHQYLYDRAGRIVEENSLFYFQRYLYENDRLVKVESAFDDALLSSNSSAFVGKTDFMTSKNSAVKSYSLYKYDNAGRLSKTEHYYNMNGKEFELRSVRTFEYVGTNIVKVNLCDEKGRINQYVVFSYDKNGNVTNEKSFSNIIRPNELISETSYKYDNYKNPYQIFNMTGNPGMYTNANNIIETNLTRHSEVQGFDKYSTSKNTYKYNKSGYPIKVNENGNEFEYQY